MLLLLLLRALQQVELPGRANGAQTVRTIRTFFCLFVAIRLVSLLTLFSFRIVVIILIKVVDDEKICRETPSRSCVLDAYCYHVHAQRCAAHGVADCGSTTYSRSSLPRINEQQTLKNQPTKTQIARRERESARARTWNGLRITSS